jgi:hypothetical protein
VEGPLTFTQLLARYQAGAIAGHEFAVESLNQVDPLDPSEVLNRMPPEILPRLDEFLDQYQPGQMIASQGGPIPTPARVRAARLWIDRAREVGIVRVG